MNSYLEDRVNKAKYHQSFVLCNEKNYSIASHDYLEFESDDSSLSPDHDSPNDVREQFIFYPLEERPTAPSMLSTPLPLVASVDDVQENKQQLPIGARWPRIMRMTPFVRSMTHKQQSTFGSSDEHQHSIQLFPSIARRQRINLHIRLSPGRRPSNDTKNNPLDYLNVQKNAKQQYTFKKLESFALRDDASTNPTLIAFRRNAKISKTTTTVETDRLSFLRARAALLLLPKINEARKLNQSCR